MRNEELIIQAEDASKRTTTVHYLSVGGYTVEAESSVKLKSILSWGYKPATIGGYDGKGDSQGQRLDIMAYSPLDDRQK